MTARATIDTRDGGVILLPASPRRGLTDEMVDRYVRALVSEAEEHYGWLWIERPSRVCLDAVRAVWDVIAPGWTDDLDERRRGRRVPCTDQHLAALIAHSAMSYHLDMIGAVTLPAARAAAYRVLAARPELAARRVRGYMGYSDYPATYTLSELLLVEGSCLVASERVLDTDAFDERDITQFRVVAVRGQAVEQYITTLAAVRS